MLRQGQGSAQKCTLMEVFSYRYPSSSAPNAREVLEQDSSRGCTQKEEIYVEGAKKRN